MSDLRHPSEGATQDLRRESVIMQDFLKLHETLIDPGFGSISGPEAQFIAGMISREKPRLFVEIGTATGLSTILIHEALKETPGTKLITVDLQDRFWGYNREITVGLAARTNICIH